MGNYKEKYESLIEAIKQLQKANPSDEGIQNWVNDNVPELKESKGEEIRKSIIQTLKRYAECVEDGHDAPSAKDFVIREVESQIAWLEKQELKSNPYSGVSFKYNGHTWGMCARDGGVEILMDSELKAFVSLDKSFVYPTHPQPDLAPKSALEAIKEEKVDNQNCVNPADKIKPKFKVGDWIVTDKNHIWLIDKDCSTTGYSYRLISQNGKVEVGDYNIVDEHARLWTIQDAKDGDVLNTKGAPFIYKKHDKDYVYLYCGVNLSNEFVEAKKIDSWNNNNKVYPATKEQRDTLFAKMREAGYMWDAEKKELKMVDPADEIGQKFKVGDIVQYITDSTDRRKIAEIDTLCNMYHTDSSPIMFEIEDEWKVVVNAEDVEWSEEDEKNLRRAIRATKVVYPVAADWLKSIENRVIPRPKQQWSKKDEETVTGIINDIQERLEDYPTEQLADIYFKEIKWLKSLKHRQTWKPSEKQIEALEDEVRNNKTVFRKKVLNELLEQLKKL